MSCDEVRELLPAYALDALTDEERADVRAHLEGCALHPEVGELRATVLALAGLAAPVEPPAALRTRVLSAALARPAPAAPGRLPARAGRRTLPARGRVLLPYALAAAFAALAIGLGVWGGARGGGADVQTYVTRDTNGAQARVVALPENGLVVVTVTNLPQLEEGRVYQAWAVRGATPESLGTFNTDASGSASMAMQAVLHSGETLAFTVEPAGGSLAPTTAPFLATRF